MSYSPVLKLQSTDGTVTLTPTTGKGIVNLSVTGGSPPSASAYYLVTRSTSAPINATNLGSLTTGVLQQSVTGGVATVGVSTLGSTAVAFGTGDGRITSDANFTYSSFANLMTVPAVRVSGLTANGPIVYTDGSKNLTNNSSFFYNSFTSQLVVPSLKLTGYGSTGFLKRDNATSDVYVDTSNYIVVGGAVTTVGGLAGSWNATILNFLSDFDVANPSGAIEVTLAPTGVAPGAYTNADVTVDLAGRITAISNGSSGGSGITQLTGDVTAGPGSGSQAATISNSAVTYAKIQNVTNARVLGNVSGSAAAPSELTASDLSTLLSLSSTYQPILSLTAGSVLFSGGGSTVSQDNSNLFYDGTSHRLGLGTASPATTLEVNGVVSVGPHATGSRFQLYNPDNTANIATAYFYPLDGTNTGSLLALMPKGTTATIKAQVTLYGTDRVADATNTEFSYVRQTAASLQILSSKSGTGTARPINIQASTTGVAGSNKGITYNTDGSVTIGDQALTVLNFTSAGFVKTNSSGVLSVDTGAYQPALSLSATSVLFSGGGSTVSQDNANFNYTAGTTTLYVTALSTQAIAGTGPLTVAGNGATTLREPTGNVVVDAQLGAASIQANSSGSGHGLFLTGSSSRLSGLTNNGFVKTSGSNGTLSVDTTTYLSTTSAASTYLTIATAATTYQPILAATATRVFYSGGGSTVSSNGSFTWNNTTDVLTLNNASNFTTAWAGLHIQDVGAAGNAALRVDSQIRCDNFATMNGLPMYFYGGAAGGTVSLGAEVFRIDDGSIISKDSSGNVNVSVSGGAMQLGDGSIGGSLDLQQFGGGGTVQSSTGDLFVKAQPGSSNASKVRLTAGNANDQVTISQALVALIANSTANNVSFFDPNPAFNGGQNVIAIRNRAAAPSGNFASGGYLFAEAGALYWRGSAGTVTPVAPA